MPKIIKIPHPKKVQPIIKTKTELRKERREENEKKVREKTRFAQKLADNPTASEVLMCGLLDGLHIKYRFQEIVCGYIPDFVFEGKKILELDGKYHKKQKKYDDHRDKVLRKHGYSVLRISSGRMFWDADRVTELIKSYVFGTKKKDLPKPKRKKKNRKENRLKKFNQVEETDELKEQFFFYTDGL